MNLKIGDTSENGQITIIDEDRLCYLVKSASRGAEGVRTISKSLLSEYIAYFSKNPNASANDARDTLSGQSDIDKFEYGYTSTLKAMAQMELGQIGTTSVSIDNIPDQDLPFPLQRIFYGAPGTGKSNTIKREVEDKGRIHFRTTFHPDSDYSTFVGCYKPTTTKSSNTKEQTVLDYESLVDKFKEYLEAKPTNITKACTLFGYSFHDSIVRVLEGTKTIPDLVADAYKSGSTYDSQVRAGMSVYETNPLSINETIQITYEFVPQAFAKAYCEAWNKYGESENADVFLIIEEINRGNCAQIFGDIFQLLDREMDGDRCGFSTYPIDADEDLKTFLEVGVKKDGSQWLTNKEGIKDGKLCLPPNLYIWATMNTSDQSLFPIDSAFKRRWDWKYVPIDTKKENWSIKIGDENYSWSSSLEKINEEIDATTHSEDKMLGFYFCRANNNVIDADKFVSKVLFYIYNDVFKDYGFDREMFKDEEGKVMSFKSYYKTDGTINERMVLKFLDNLKVEKNTIEDNANNDPNIKTE